MIEPTISVPKVHSLTGIQVLATGSYVPDVVVKNEDLARLGFDPEWIVQRTGIRERRFLPAHLATSDMAIEAARRCVARAGVTAGEVDLVVVGTFTPDMSIPAVACLVQDRLGTRGAAMDVNSACAGFLYALITGAQFVATGASRLALVIGADCNSRLIDPNDRKVYPLFGDGAGAVLLARGASDQGLTAYTFGADGSGAELLCRRLGGSRYPLTAEGLAGSDQFLHMDGKPVFKWAIRVIDETVRAVLGSAGLTAHDIDLYLLHQANIRIIQAAADQLGIDREKLFINLDRYGNTSAGSVPLALDEAVSQGLVARGKRLVLCGYGAGLSWGTAILQW